MVLRSEAKSRVLALRSRVQEFNTTYERLATNSAVVAHLGEVDQAIINANQEISEMNFQMGQHKGIWRGGILYHGMNMLDNDAYEGFKAHRDDVTRNRDVSLIPQRDTLRRQQPGRGLEQARNAISGRGEAALTAMTEARQAVDATTRAYAELANDDAVRRALARSGHVKFEPSESFKSAVHELELAEKTVSKVKLAIGR